MDWVGLLIEFLNRVDEHAEDERHFKNMRKFLILSGELVTEVMTVLKMSVSFEDLLQPALGGKSYIFDYNSQNPPATY